MMQPTTPTSRAGRAIARRGGFTAIEISAVATIIAILVLILVPILRKRVDETRITAAMADMRQIETAQIGAQADTGYYVRLFDLTRPSADESDSMEQAQMKLPAGSWNMPPTTATFNAFHTNWKGPYLIPQRQRTLFEVVQAMPHMFRGDQVGGLNPQSGPVLILEEDDYDELGQAALQRIKYPIDPWGNPYLFFGTGRIGEFGYTIPANVRANETDFTTAVIYSFGPNGVPGNVPIPQSAHFYRETGTLGTGDDLAREF